VPYVSAKINNPFFTKKAFVERRQLIAQAVGDVLTLEIWHQPDGMANILVRTICDELGLVPSDADAATPTWATKELTVTIRKHSLGALGEPLQIGNTKGRRRERLHAAIAQRIRDVEEQLAMVPSMGAHAAFIELADALGFKGVTDPKYALRLGFASRGRVTQFITPPGDERTDPLSCPKHTSGMALDQQRSNHPRGNRLWRPISICYQDSRTAYRAPESWEHPAANGAGGERVARSNRGRSYAAVPASDHARARRAGHTETATSRRVWSSRLDDQH